MSFDDLFGAFSPWDVVDVLAVALIAYNLLLLIRGTRAVQVLFGIIVLVGVAFIAKTLELETLEWVLNGFLLIIPFAAIILFQNEIRKGLSAFGKNPLRFARQQDQAQSHQNIARAAKALASRQVGALIVIERTQGLREYIENGIELDAQLSIDLLLTIFMTTTPLHDGAVIVQGDRIAAASSFLPLSSNPGLSTRSGTRHRAALGISEETDALAVIVSEETGRVAVAVGGQLQERLDHKGLREILHRHLVEEAELAKPAEAT